MAATQFVVHFPESTMVLLGKAPRFADAGQPGAAEMKIEESDFTLTVLFTPSSGYTEAEEDNIDRLLAHISRDARLRIKLRQALGLPKEGPEPQPRASLTPLNRDKVVSPETVSGQPVPKLAAAPVPGQEEKSGVRFSTPTSEFYVDEMTGSDDPARCDGSRVLPFRTFERAFAEANKPPDRPVHIHYAYHGMLHVADERVSALSHPPTARRTHTHTHARTCTQPRLPPPCVCARGGRSCRAIRWRGTSRAASGTGRCAWAGPVAAY